MKAGETLRERGFHFGCAYTSYLKTGREDPQCRARSDGSGLDSGDEDVAAQREALRHVAREPEQARDGRENGDEQVRIWRRSYDVAPAPLGRGRSAQSAPRSRYAGIPDAELPGTESLRPWPARCPIGSARYSPALARYDQVLVVAHGNSLRGIIKNLKGISTRPFRSSTSRRPCPTSSNSTRGWAM